jgi:hypothetical protein
MMRIYNPNANAVETGNIRVFNRRFVVAAVYSGCPLRCVHVILILMKRLLLGLLLVPVGMVQALDTSHILTAEQWAVPRNVQTIIQMPALAGAMAELQATPGGRLLIRYPGGDAGTLWMNELHSWLVSLGLSSADMERVPGSANSQVIELEVLLPASKPAEARKTNSPRLGYQEVTP